VNVFGNWELGALGDEDKGDPFKVFITIFILDRTQFSELAYLTSLE